MYTGNIDESKISFLLLLDHSKAFDSVDHKMLSYKLRNKFPFSSTALKMIDSYLTNRKQATFANGKMSSFVRVPHGVPQGSIMGLLLFLMYINDLPNIIENYNQIVCNKFQFRIQLYADDVQLYVSCSPSDVSMCVESINKCLSNVSTWAKCNGLSLNPKNLSA